MIFSKVQYMDAVNDGVEYLMHNGILHLNDQAAVRLLRSHHLGDEYNERLKNDVNYKAQILRAANRLDCDE